MIMSLACAVNVLVNVAIDTAINQKGELRINRDKNYN